MNHLDFEPQGMCYLWVTNLITLHVIGDILIALAYFSIPILLIYLFRDRIVPHGKYLNLLLWFAAFIFLCGITHLVNIIEIWTPIYYISSTLKIATGLVSLGALIRLSQAISAFLHVVDIDATEISIALHNMRKLH